MRAVPIQKLYGTRVLLSDCLGGLERMICAIQCQVANRCICIVCNPLVILDNKPTQIQRRESCKCRFSIIFFFVAESCLELYWCSERIMKLQDLEFSF